jgi:hypothetical protein
MILSCGMRQLQLFSIIKKELRLHFYLIGLMCVSIYLRNVKCCLMFCCTLLKLM